jgi:hypothetical protein
MIDTKIFCQVLKFAAAAASTKDVRFYLCGVRFEFTNNTLTLVGTNGASAHVGAIYLEHGLAGQTSADPDRAFIVDNDSVKRILSAFGKDKGQVVFTATPHEDPKKYPTLSLTAAGMTITPVCVDGQYPDWRRVVPAADRPVGQTPGMDAPLLSKALAAITPMAGATGKGTYGLAISAGPNKGDAVAIRPHVTTDPRITTAVAVVMPLRG